MCTHVYTSHQHYYSSLPSTLLPSSWQAGWFRPFPSDTSPSPVFLSELTNQGWTVQPVLLRLHCLDSAALADLLRLSCPGCPSQLPCPCCCVLAVLTWLSYYGCPAMEVRSPVVLPQLPVLADMYWPSFSLFCPRCTVPTVVTCSPGPAVLSPMSCPCYHVHFWKSCLIYLVPIA